VPVTACRLVLFANGTRKLVLPPAPGAEALGRAACATLIAFGNGDFKHQLPGGTTEYYYAEVGQGFWECAGRRMF
jgi:hypothetical protein